MPILRGLLIGAVILLLGGCARYPSTTSDVPETKSTLYSSITVRGVINSTYYYFLAIDTDGDPATGPVPIVAGPEWGNGWGTISGLGANSPLREPPFYVMYHNGQLQQFRNGTPIGAPYRGEIVDGNRLAVEVTLEALGTPLPDTLQLNWITLDAITTFPQSTSIDREYDGFGPTGNTYLDVNQLTASLSWASGVGGRPEEAPDDTTGLADVDLIEWRVETRIRSATP
jgi:hypothetical protein